jgi:uncharacterized protein YcbK (DUF882 family)
MANAPPWTNAPELKRVRKELARKRREPIRIIIASDPSRPVRTLTIPRFLPTTILIAAAALLVTAVGLSFSTWSLSGSVRRLKSRAVAMMQLADGMALHPQGIAVAGTFRQSGLTTRTHKPSGAQGRFTIEAANFGEQIDVVVDLASGEIDEASYRSLRRLMRCRRTGAEVPIDPRLIELLWGLSQRAGQPIVLISGYRAPGYAAPASYHTRGMAADIRIPGLTTLMVRDLARAMGARGIGYYPRSQFVHVDLRDEPYYWTDLGTGEGEAEVEVEPAKDGTGEKDGRLPDP